MEAEAVARAKHERSTPGWIVVAGQELRDLWLGGRGLVLSFAFSLLLSAISYLVATNRALNFLEQRESVNLTLQVAIAVGALLALLSAADAVSGERERGTLESLLVTPVSRLELTLGKLLAALSLWVVAFVITVPYVWFLGRGVGLVANAVATGFVVGTLLAIFLASFGILISVFAASNRVSISLSLLVLLALFVPTQLPSSAQQGWAGDLLLRLNPMTAGEHYVGKIVTNGHGWSQDISWLVSPLVAAVIFAAAALVAGARFTEAERRLRMTPARLAFVVGLLLAVAPAAHAAGSLTVSNDRTTIATKLGHKFVFHSTIRNNGTTPASGLVAHLNVVDLSGHTYVDPEDWSSHRTRYLASIPAGGSTTLAWPMNAVNSGTIGVYVAVLPRSGAPVPPTTGPTVHVRIQDRKTLDSGGILPLALGLPALLGVLALGVRLRRAR